MDWPGIILAATLTTADYTSTQHALARGGREVGPIKNQPVRASLQLAALAGTDALISRRAPKLKWWWRGAATLGMGAVVAHNYRVR